MNHIIGDILPMAVGVAISPIPIISIILMLSTPNARKVGPAFALGWMATLAAISTVVALAAGVMNVGDGGGPGTVGSFARLGLGILLLGFAAKSWRDRPGPGQPAEMPHWMQTLDTIPPREAAGIAALLAGVNPKNLILAVAAGAAIAQDGANLATGLLGVVLFVLVASVTILLPLAVYFLMGARAAAILDGWKQSMSEHNAVIMAVLLIILGVVLVAKGLEGLL